jgi:hypothetical protein
MASGRQNMDRFRGKKPAEEKVSKKNKNTANRRTPFVTNRNQHSKLWLDFT